MRETLAIVKEHVPLQIHEVATGTQVLDSVAQFHLNNGARLNRIFWLADTSPRGLRQSCGMMVSYRYDPSEVDKNHDRFLASGHIATAGRIQNLIG